MWKTKNSEKQTFEIAIWVKKNYKFFFLQKMHACAKDVIFFIPAKKINARESSSI